MLTKLKRRMDNLRQDFNKKIKNIKKDQWEQKSTREINNTLESLAIDTSSRLYGKKIGFLGDSYIANNNWHKIEGDNIEPHTYTWAYKIAKKYRW